MKPTRNNNQPPASEWTADDTATLRAVAAATRYELALLIDWARVSVERGETIDSVLAVLCACLVRVDPVTRAGLLAQAIMRAAVPGWSTTGDGTP